MLIVIILVCAFVLAGAAITSPLWSDAMVDAKRRKQRKELEKKKQEGIANGTIIERPRMSIFSHYIVDEFMKLPEDNRPFTVQELMSSLVALDVKVGISEVNRHFTSPGSYSYSSLPLQDRFTLNCAYVYNYRSTRQRPHDCPQFDEYRELLKGIIDIRNALIVQEKTLAISAVQPSLDAVKSLTDALRGEAEIVNKVTKDFC